MSIHSEVREFRLWKAISQQFPNAEIVRPDGSRKKLSEIFKRALKRNRQQRFLFRARRIVFNSCLSTLETVQRMGVPND